MSPAASSGFVYRMVAGVAGWLCRECDWKFRVMQPPPTRGHCIDGPRPCRALLCKYNMAWDISRKAKDDFELTETCALDIADQGSHTLREIGVLLGMTREGVRGIEVPAMEKLRGMGLMVGEGDE